MIKRIIYLPDPTVKFYIDILYLKTATQNTRKDSVFSSDVLIVESGNEIKRSPIDSNEYSEITDTNFKEFNLIFESLLEILIKNKDSARDNSYFPDQLDRVELYEIMEFDE